METTFKDALDNALAVTGRSLRSVALSAGVSYEQLKNLRQGKAQRTNVDDALKVAHAFGVSLEQFYSGALSQPRDAIAVAGRVGAGAVVKLVDDHAKGNGLYHISRPPQMGAISAVGVEVAGDSMAPVYQPGDVLLYRREVIGVPSEALGRICVAEDAEGNAWVKQIKRGSAPGLFHLLSANPAGDNLLDVPLSWAAPVRLHLPAEFVVRV